MIAANQQLIVPLHIATVVVPVAVYFLVLGLLNSRRHPQLLRGRRDFALLVIALSPLFALPALSYIGISPLTVVGVAAAVGGLVWAMAPRGESWVIYNTALPQAARAVEQALTAMGLHTARSRRHVFRLQGQDATIEVTSFSLLRNVSIRLRGGDAPLARRFERELAVVLGEIRTEPHPMAVGLLLVATAMLVAPLALVAHRAGEIVRILTDLLN